MTASLQDGTVTVHLRTPSGEVPLGEFALTSGEVRGTDQRGISYRGTCTPLLNGVNVELTLTVPVGTRLAADLLTDVAAERQLSLYLSEEHLAGTRVKAVNVPGLGSADVVFTVR